MLMFFQGLLIFIIDGCTGTWFQHLCLNATSNDTWHMSVINQTKVVNCNKCNKINESVIDIWLLTSFMPHSPLALYLDRLIIKHKHLLLWCRQGIQTTVTNFTAVPSPHHYKCPASNLSFAQASPDLLVCV